MEEFENKMKEMPFYSLQTSFFLKPWRTLVEALQYILQINGKVVTDAITVVVRKEG